jgi:tetratricopeptide (TPR) repeat protein
MKLIKAIAKYPEIRIFRVKDSDNHNQAKWDVEPISAFVLSESNDFFIVKAKHILPTGIIQDCYLDISLPERINDCAYFFSKKSLIVTPSHELDGDLICAVPIDCFGNYELFYSKLNPEIGIQILKEGLAVSLRKHIIADDLGYIYRDEERYQEAARMFQVSVDETPSSYFLYGELATCYLKIGETEKAKKYQEIFTQNNKIG